MQIDSVNLPTHVQVRLTGRFDFSNRDKFITYIKETISRAEVPEVRIDMAGVVYIDSSALGQLLMARDFAKQSEREITLTNPQPIVRQTLETAQFPRLFKFI